MDRSSEIPNQLPDDDVETTGKRTLSLTQQRITFVIALAYSIFNIVALVIMPVGPWIHLPVNLAFASVLTLLIYKGPCEARKGLAKLVDALFIVAALACTIYYMVEYKEMVWRIAAFPTTLDVVFSALLIVVSLEITRRASGLALSLVGLGFLLYGFFGNYIPGFLGHSGFSFERIVTYLYSDTGIFGTALAAASSFVFLFILFGSFLNKFGCGEVFIDLATGLAGHTRGGPAKVAVMSSALFGSVAGSSIANVAATGSFTIPLMKRIGYRPEFAGAVEAAASTGGQIMPPVMGSTAFILAEIVGVAYPTLALKSMFPAILYFLSVLIMVDLEAVRTGLQGLPKSELPSVKKVLREKGAFLLPIVAIFVALLVLKVSTSRAAILGICTALLVPLLAKGVEVNWRGVLEAIAGGATGVLNIIASCTTAGIIIGILALTGLGVKIGTALIHLSGGNIFFLLVAAMFLSMLLGMGLPTAAAYIITGSVIGPGLTMAGVPMLTAHLFIFYFSLLAMVTPPVALASYTAAGIANASASRTGWEGFKLCIAAFIVPYLFVYRPALILEGTPVEIIYSIIVAIAGIMLLGCGVQGFFLRKANAIQRVLLITASLCLLSPSIIADLAALTLVIVTVVINSDTREAATTAFRGLLGKRAQTS